MKNHIALILALVLLCGLAAGCAEKGESPAAVTEAPSAPAPEQLYAEAAERLNQAEGYRLDIEMHHVVTIGEKSFYEDVKQDISFSRRSGESLWHSLESFDYDGISLSIEEYANPSEVYASIDGEHMFRGAANEGEIRYLPAVMLDAKLYSEISFTAEGENTVIFFKEPSALEAWLGVDGLEYSDVSAETVIDAEGNITQMRYCFGYTYVSARHEWEIISRPSAFDGEIELPQVENYTELDCVDAPRRYVCSEALLAQYTDLSYVNSYYVEFHAADMHDHAYLNMDVCGEGDDFSFESRFEAAAFFEMGTKVDRREVFEEYSQGLYMTSSDDKGWVEADREVMERQVNDSLEIPTVPLKYWADASVEDLGGVLLFKIALNEEYADSTLRFISENYYESPEHLSTVCSDIESEISTAYFCYDCTSGLPLSRGYDQSANCTMDTGLPSGYRVRIDQRISPVSPVAETRIRDYITRFEGNDITPLLYKVSGEQGETMWLLCGSVFGSQQDRYPDELYEILDSCDTYMLMFDSNASDQRYRYDDSYALRINDMQTYSEGTITEHIGMERFNQLADRLLVLGNYYEESSMLKAISAYDGMSFSHMPMTHYLSEELSTATVFLEYARSKGKEVVEAIDLLSQLEYRNALSDDVAIACIDEYIDYGCEAYALAELELHRRWSEGDEEYAIEQNSYDGSGLDEELADLISLCNSEYLEAAINQLQSGKSCFFVSDMSSVFTNGSGLYYALQDAGYTVERYEIS